MQSREQLEKRLADLEKKLSTMQGAGTVGVIAVRGVRKRASWEVGNLPFYDIAFGPDFDRGEVRGHARGFIAIGDMATGVFALGGLARGVVAIGGLALGLVSFGGLSIGVLAAAGGLAIGGLAVGGGAIGGVAFGGGAAGYYACGSLAGGAHAVDTIAQDAEAARFFREHGLPFPCGGDAPD
jgi:hypothetical protein